MDWPKFERKKNINQIAPINLKKINCCYLECICGPWIGTRVSDRLVNTSSIVNSSLFTDCIWKMFVLFVSSSNIQIWMLRYSSRHILYLYPNCRSMRNKKPLCNVMTSLSISTKEILQSIYILFLSLLIGNRKL